MEPFRGQYPDTSYSSAYPPPPGSEPMNYTYAPTNPAPNTTSSKPFFSSHAYSAPPYDPQNTKTRRTWRWKFRNISSNFWLWEAFAILITLAIAAAIGHQLKKLDGRSTYYWKWVWSPTSVLALGVTIAKAAMMVPVASALGQLKWHRYKRAQKLDGLEKFDDASRGVIGSLKLLWELKCWHIASIGALITVCALSLDSLTQNAVRIALVPDFTYDDSWVHRTGRFEAVSYFRQRSKDLPSSNMLPPLYYAISATEAPAFDQSLAHCESVNCTYGTYDSLAVDYQCIPAKAERSGSAYLHSGMKDTNFFLDGTDIIKSNTTLALPPSGSYKDLGPLIARWLVLLNPSTLRPAPTAMECAFYWTVKKYHGETVNGVFHETALATYTNASNPGTLKQDIYITPGECWRDNRSVPITTQNCTNVVGYPSHASLQSWFTLDDFGVRGYAANDTKRGDAEEFWDYSSIFMQSIMSKLVDMNATTVASTINDTADALATTMTATIRRMAETFDPAGNTYGIVNGTTEWSPMVVYVIAWKYLVVPALIVALSALFFVATVVFTWGEGGWKSSQLALIFHGLGDTDVRAAGDVREYADMREAGRGMRVRLVDGVDGRRLVSEKVMGA